MFDYIYLVTSEDKEFLAASDSLLGAETFCKHYASENGDIAGEAEEFPEELYSVPPREQPAWRVTLTAGEDSDAAFDYDLFIDRVKFYHTGTLFPFETGLSHPVEIPAFLRKQAE